MKSFYKWLNENDELSLDLDIDKPIQSQNIQSLNEPSIQSKDLGNAIEVSYPGPNVKGYLHAQQDSKNPKLYRVIRVTVSPQGQGYGKKLYIAAMRIASEKGAMLTSAGNSTSDSANYVWNSLYKNPKYKKIPLAPNDWPESPRNNKMMKKYPNLRFRDPTTYPPKNDIEFWAINSGYVFNF